MPPGYAAVLRRPGILRLFLLGNLARLPGGFHTLATVLLVRATTGSYALAGVAAAASFVVMTATAAPLGRLVDRHGQRRVLVPAAFWGTVGFAALGLAGHLDAPAPVLIAAAALSGIVPPVASSERAILADQFTGADRERAYALEAIIQEGVWTVGPLIGTLALVVGGPTAMLAVAGVLVLVGTSLFAAMPLSRDWRPVHAERGRGGALASPGLRTVLMLGALSALSFGQFEVAVPAFTEQHGSRDAAGVMLALWAVGSAIGGLAYGRSKRRRPPWQRIAIIAMCCAIGFLPAAVAPSNLVLAPAALVAGLGIAPLLANIYNQIGAVASEGMVTEAFSWLNVAFPAGFGIGSALAGVIADGPGAHVAMAVAGVGVALAALLVYLRRDTLAGDDPGEGRLV